MINQPSAHRLRLLVVDDRRDSVLLLKALLTHAGHEVTTAVDGASGLELARKLSPHAIISDIELSGAIDGCAFAHAVRSDSSIPVPRLIAVTGHDDEEHRRLAKDAGFEHYLVKPPEIDELLAILARIDAAAGSPSEE